ncbi:hypothetical protein [Nostoc sp.]|uniref:hypothetical protein n=1 Tax=Nostoc sp. TaxID=1180 RepID=UPI002FFC0267
MNNSKLNLQPGGITIRGERWYTESANTIAGLFDVHGKVRQDLSSQVQNINGMNLRQLLIQYGSQVTNYQQQDVIERINMSIRNIKARVSGSNLIISVGIPVG